MKEKNLNIEHLFGKLKKETPFRVPENYFETFADRLNVRIQEEKNSYYKRSLFIYFKPMMAVAAILVLSMLLIYIPITKLLPSDSGNIVQNRSEKNVNDSVSGIPAALISNFSEEQLLAAFSASNDLDSKTLTADNLAVYIADNYSSYEILTDN